MGQTPSTEHSEPCELVNVLKPEETKTSSNTSKTPEEMETNPDKLITTKETETNPDISATPGETESAPSRLTNELNSFSTLEMTESNPVNSGSIHKKVPSLRWMNLILKFLF